MDVNRSESIAPVAKRDPRKDRQARHDDDGEESQEEELTHEDPWADEDAVAFEGSLSASVTPEVQAALEALAGRLEPMRVDLERSREREAALRAQLDRHTYLPVLNRNGLEHEVTRVGARLRTQSDDLTASPLFVCVSVRNAHDLRRRLGRSAYDQAMTAACETLKSCFGDNAIYGCLGGDDLGIIVFGGDIGDGELSPVAVAGQITQAFADAPAMINGGSHALFVDVGVCSLMDHPTFAAALAAADAHLMRRARA
ncbi:MAG: hypothetical protein RIC16_03080 [Rhodospirillales bacterium]